MGVPVKRLGGNHEAAWGLRKRGGVGGLVDSLCGFDGSDSPREGGDKDCSALTLYRKRKTESLQGKKLPENLRTPTVSFADLATDALSYSKTHKITCRDDQDRMPWLLAAFRDRAAD